MTLRTSLIIGAIILAFVSWMTALSMPRRPDFVRAFTWLVGMNVAAAILFTVVFVYDDPDIGPGFNFWAVPIAIFLIAFGVSVLARAAAKRLGKRSYVNGLDFNGLELIEPSEPSLARREHTDGNGLDMEWLSRFRFTGTGVGFLTHIHDADQEVGCVVGTPYRGMTLDQLIDVANRHQCQEIRVVAA